MEKQETGKVVFFEVMKILWNTLKGGVKIAIGVVNFLNGFFDLKDTYFPERKK